jgi:hypothetical protein
MLVGGYIESALKAAMALASHFHGNGELGYDFRPVGDQKAIIIKKNGKQLYCGQSTGEFSDPMLESLSKLFVDIIKKEKVQKRGKRHQKCHICIYLFTSVQEALRAIAVGLQISDQLGAVLQKAMESAPPPSKEEREHTVN